LTAAVRDLHLSHPKQFITDVRTPCGQLWENNPYLTPEQKQSMSAKLQQAQDQQMQMQQQQIMAQMPQQQGIPQ